MANTDVGAFTVTLRDAIAEWQGPRLGNSYNRYRKSSLENGRIFFGRASQLTPGGSRAVYVAVIKIGNRWMVDPTTIKQALA